jgi:uncharacterized cupin superfamily protein
VLVTDAGKTPLAHGMCAGFPRGTGDANHLPNRSGRDVLVLEVGDRCPGDRVTYADDGLTATMEPDRPLHILECRRNPDRLTASARPCRGEKTFSPQARRATLRRPLFSHLELAVAG